MSKRGIKGGDSLGEDSGRGSRGRGEGESFSQYSGEESVRGLRRRGRGSGRGRGEGESFSQDSSEESVREFRRTGSSREIRAVHDFVVESSPKNLLQFSFGEIANALDRLAPVKTVTLTEKDYEGTDTIIQVLEEPPLHEIQHLSDVSGVVTRVASSSVISEHSFATIDVSKEAAPDSSSSIISTNVREAKAPDTGSSVVDTPFITTDVGEEATSKCEYLPEATYQIIVKEGDGNCLFRALACGDYLQRMNTCPTGMYEQCLADVIRAKVVLELLERRDEVERSSLIEYQSMKYSDFDSYFNYITQDRTWGAVPEIHMVHMASHVFRRPIWVYRYDEEKGGLVRFMDTPGYEEHKPIKLLGNTARYDLVVELG